MNIKKAQSIIDQLVQVLGNPSWPVVAVDKSKLPAPPPGMILTPMTLVSSPFGHHQIFLLLNQLPHNTSLRLAKFAYLLSCARIAERTDTRIFSSRLVEFLGVPDIQFPRSTEDIVLHYRYMATTFFATVWPMLWLHARHPVHMPFLRDETIQYLKQEQQSNQYWMENPVNIAVLAMQLGIESLMQIPQCDWIHETIETLPPSIKDRVEHIAQVLQGFPKLRGDDYAERPPDNIRQADAYMIRATLLQVYHLLDTSVPLTAEQ